MSGPELFVIFLVVGILLITVEIFIPGGVLGGIGAMALAGAVVTGFFAFGLHGGSMATAGMVVLGGVVIFAWLKFFPRTFAGKKLTLSTDMGTAKSAPVEWQSFTGKAGVAKSDLRPAGVAEIDGQRVDVVAESGFIRTGAPIRVVTVEGFRVIVREVKS
jgi:membrane-bound serine protease (ClpP class)